MTAHLTTRAILRVVGIEDSRRHYRVIKVEDLNGVTKVINRSGRGYTFEMLRARVLFNKYELFGPPCFNVDPDITAEEFKVLEDSFVRCLSCFEPKTPEDHSVVCKRCLSRLHQDDLFLEAVKEYGLH